MIYSIPKRSQKIIVVNYSEKNCRKFFRGKILRKILPQNFAKKVMCSFAQIFSRKYFNFFSAKSFSRKLLRKNFRQNREKIFFAKYFSQYLGENIFREKICAKVFTKNISRKKKKKISAKIFAQKFFRQNFFFSRNFVKFFTKGFFLNPYYGSYLRINLTAI